MTGKSLYITLGAIVLVLVAALGILMYLKAQKPLVTPPVANVPSTTTSPTEPQGTVAVKLLPKFVTQNDASMFELWLQPVNGTQPLSTLAAKITVKPSSGSLRALGNQATIGPNFKSQDWSFPFSEVVTNDDGSLTINLSAIYISTQAYELGSEPSLLASVPVMSQNATGLTATLDPEVSKLYDKQASPLLFDQTGSAITVEAM